MSKSFNEVREPLEPIRVPNPPLNATHEHLNRPRPRVPLLGVLPIRLVVVQPELLPQLVLAQSRALVYLVPEDHEGHLLKFRHLQQLV